jgi:predicted nuclease of predicted toxin-antitoxin system
MKFKLDENFGTRTQHIFKKAEHDVQTVRQELLQGASDQCIYEVCCKERRCLVTLDLDFSEVTRFPPDKSCGIAVIRLPRNPSLDLLEKLFSNSFAQPVKCPWRENCG